MPVPALQCGARNWRDAACLSHLGWVAFDSLSYAIREAVYCINCQRVFLFPLPASCSIIARGPGVSCLCGLPTSGCCTGTSCRGRSRASHGCGGSSRTTGTYSAPWSRWGFGAKCAEGKVKEVTENYCHVIFFFSFL